MAPEVGLFLVKCLFENYNKRFASTHEPLDADRYLEAVREDDSERHAAAALAWMLPTARTRAVRARR